MTSLLMIAIALPPILIGVKILLKREEQEATINV
jgi:hypothetical protein